MNNLELKKNNLIDSISLIKNKMYLMSDKERYSRLLNIMRDSVPADTYEVRKKLLIKQLQFAHNHIDYWREMHFLSELDSENCEYLLKKIPLLDKNTLYSDKELLFRRGGIFGKKTIGRTGGTTGMPLEFYRGWSDEKIHQCVLYEYITGEVFTKLNRRGIIASFDGTRPSENDLKNKIFWTWLEQGVYGSISFCSIYMSDDNMKYYIEELNRLRPLILRGYSNAILSLAQYIYSTGAFFYKPLGIYVTSEKCSKETMTFISNVIGCPVHGQYGQNEACSFAWTKPSSSSYIFSPLYSYVEIVDDFGNDVKEGDIGEIVCTSFGNAVQPFVRYKTGDIVKLKSNNNGIVIVSEVVGRNNDYLLDAKGKKVYASGFLDVHYFSFADKINKIQIIQKKKGEVIVKLIANNILEEDIIEIKELLNSRGFICKVEIVDVLEHTKNGKQKLIIRELDD